ncbi:MAG: hypothetical protein COC23_04595 [Hyphomicrobiales bacterium]|nr:MAG: hypothetical protein COC23_04595 [Hyphomicrobiales bacterium]
MLFLTGCGAVCINEVSEKEKKNMIAEYLIDTRHINGISSDVDVYKNIVITSKYELRNGIYMYIIL